jgi:hypothetical protein
MKSKRAFGAIDRLPSGNYRARWRQDEKGSSDSGGEHR